MADPMDLDEPRGTKRKIDEALRPVEAPRRIKQLDPDVVNKIAAGEIIVAPVHALKELIENAVDAGSTSLDILVKEGGLKLLQITDNGHGINKEDLPILCERFTTSKLKAFEDLTSIGTYGFRGEALASISHIAHLTVTTKTKESDCAWRAHYSSGLLTPAKPGQTADPKPTAGRQGTQITVEDLFYNVPTRRRAFRSASDEYNKILDLVGRYAVHCPGVAFSCKKHGESSTTISTQSTATTLDKIRQIHGSSVANELIQFSLDDSKLGFKAHGWTSNANYAVKRTTLLLFINNRSVENNNMKKAIEHTYSTFLMKGTRPFIYMSLEIDPSRVDVNVHPTKREVNFLQEDEIIELICSQIRTCLVAVDTSRTFKTQTLLPGARVPKSGSASQSPAAEEPSSVNRSATPARPYENNLVRTDHSSRKITSMLPPSSNLSRNKGVSSPSPANEPTYTTSSNRQPVHCRLSAIKNLRGKVRDNMHNELTEILATHSFIGIVDSFRRLAAIQGGVRLFLVDYGLLCFEYFYQLGLTDFGNFGLIEFKPPLDVKALLLIAARDEKLLESDSQSAEKQEDWEPEEAVETVYAKLHNMRAMLSEYFQISISDDGQLQSLPLLMKGYMPCLGKLPRFLLRLGPHVDWTEEEACFETLLRELAQFYVPENLPAGNEPTIVPDSSKAMAQATPQDISKGVTGKMDGEGQETRNRMMAVEKVLEDVVFPAMKARMIGTKECMRGVLEVANLKGLYRVFERC